MCPNQNCSVILKLKSLYGKEVLVCEKLTYLCFKVLSHRLEFTVFELTIQCNCLKHVIAKPASQNGQPAIFSKHLVCLQVTKGALLKCTIGTIIPVQAAWFCGDSRIFCFLEYFSSLSTIDGSGNVSDLPWMLTQTELKYLLLAARDIILIQVNFSLASQPFPVIFLLASYFIYCTCI